jgi:hypothetical protein
MPAQTPPHEPEAAPRTVRITDDFLTSASVMAVVRLLGQETRGVLALDLAAVRLPSAGGLVALRRLNRELFGQLCLLNVQPSAYEVFELSGLTGVVDVRVSCSSPTSRLGT